MNIENYKNGIAHRKCDNLLRAQSALFEINKIFHDIGTHKPGYVESDGGCPPKDYKSLYSLYLMEYRDGSGFSIDLTGLKLHVEVLAAVKLLLSKRVKELEKEVEAL